MKTPISYYGGKQKLAPKITTLIPEHTLYCEPFAGGGAVFFAKDRSKVEVLNDTNNEIINFYQVLQLKFAALEKEIRVTLHSRDLHRHASVIYNNPDMFSDIKRAWTFWTTCNQSFSSKVDSSWGYERGGNSVSKKIKNNRIAFTLKLAERLQDVQIECADALYIIKSRDSEQSFFYLDPPYFNSNCGHYGGYTEQNFENLLVLLSGIKGKFLLSSYPSDLLKKYTEQNGFFVKQVEMSISVHKDRTTNPKRKIEQLTSNYPI